MHKLIKHKFCLFLVVAAFLFAGCSFNSLEKPSTGSVTFRINGPKNRTAVDKTNGGLSFNVDAEIFLEVELKGGYEDSKTAKIENGSASLSFMEIPVGTQLWAEASIFIIIEGNNKQEDTLSEEEIIEKVNYFTSKGMSKKDAIETVSEFFKLKKNLIKDIIK